MAFSSALLLLIMTAHSALSHGGVTITNGPIADRDCYEVNDEGMFNITYHLTDDTESLGDYKVLWKFGNKVLIDGPDVLIYENYPIEQQLTENGRWKCTIEYQKRTVTYTIRIKAMQFNDDQGKLTAYIVRISTGDIVAKADSTMQLYIEDVCPTSSGPTAQTPSPVTHPTKQPPTTSPTTTSQHTTPPPTTPPPTMSMLPPILTDTIFHVLGKIKNSWWYAMPIFLDVVNAIVSIITLGLICHRFSARPQYVPARQQDMPAGQQDFPLS